MIAADLPAGDTAAGTIHSYDWTVPDDPSAAVRVRDGSWTVLFGPHPLLGVSLPAVRYDPDGLLVEPEGAADWLSYRIRVGERPPVPTRARRDADGRYLQLPRDSRELEALRDLAGEIARGAVDDRERVARVLSYFHANFEYSLKSTEFPGLRGVVDFLSRRSGHCTYYASAATLLLRSLDIPTRIATGFLASDWEDERYVVTDVTRERSSDLLAELKAVPGTIRARVLY